MIRVNDFLADFEAHHAPPSNLKYQTSAARAGLWGNSEDADCVEALFGKYLESSKRSCEASRFRGGKVTDSFLLSLCVLCVSAVHSLYKSFTAEAQRTQGLHREYKHSSQQNVYFNGS